MVEHSSTPLEGSFDLQDFMVLFGTFWTAKEDMTFSRLRAAIRLAGVEAERM